MTRILIRKRHDKINTYFAGILGFRGDVDLGLLTALR
jgi:hypothetical protein